jgi:hypothetical protein
MARRPNHVQGRYQTYHRPLPGLGHEDGGRPVVACICTELFRNNLVRYRRALRNAPKSHILAQREESTTDTLTVVSYGDYDRHPAAIY